MVKIKMFLKPKTIIIAIVLILMQSILYTVHSQEGSKYEPMAISLENVLKNKDFLCSHLDSATMQGYALLKGGELMYIRTWSDITSGVECKFLINMEKYWDTDEGRRYWMNYILELSACFLDKDYINQISKAELIYRSEKSMLLLYPESLYYDSFEIIIKGMNIDTAVLIFYLYKRSKYL